MKPDCKEYPYWIGLDWIGCNWKHNNKQRARHRCSLGTYNLIPQKRQVGIIGDLRRGIEIAQNRTLNETEMQIALYEAMKGNRTFVDSLLEVEAKEEPEYHKAFTTERNELIANATLRETYNGATRIVTVVGASHLPGIKRLLEPYCVGPPKTMQVDSYGYARAMKAAANLLNLTAASEAMQEMEDAGVGDELSN